MATFFDRVKTYEGVVWMIKCEGDGEMAVRDMSDKAQEGYKDTGIYEVYEYRDYEHDVYLYAFRQDGEPDSEIDGLTFAEMEEFLEELAPEPEPDDEEDD